MKPDDRTSLELPPESAGQLRAFAAAVRSSPHNLLSRRALEELETRHIPECLGVAAMIPAAARRVLDVGTGGGFPGMVVAIARPELTVSLLDSTSKKIRFLADTAEAIGVTVEALDGRSEDLVRGRGGSMDVVTARAVAPLDRLLPWTLPWLRPGGLLLALKGDRWEEEIEAAVPLLRRFRATLIGVSEPGVPIHTTPPSVPDGVRPRVVIIRVPG